MRTENLTIVFVDIAGFTERTGRQSRAENAAWLQRFEQLVMPLLRTFGGRRVKSIGDAYLCTFPSPTNALLFGMAAQDRLFEHARGVSADEAFRIRVAVNAGEVRLRRGDIYGEPVNVAARVEGITPAGEIWFTEAVYLAMTRSEVPAEKVGSHELKGVAEPVALYRVPPDRRYRLAAEGEAAERREQAEPDPAPQQLPYGGLGLQRAAERGWVVGLGAAPEQMARAGRGLFQALRSRLRRVPAKVGWAAGAGLVLTALLFLLLRDDAPFAQCERALRAGRLEQAQSLLEVHPRAGSPAGRALQARILLARPQPPLHRAAELLHRAVEHDAGLLGEDAVLRALVETLGRPRAAETIGLLAEQGGAAVEPLLAGTGDERFWVRWNSVKALKAMGRVEEVDLVQVYILDLLHAGRCSRRKKAARKLAALGDRRALGPLRRAKKRGFFDNLCMGDALDEAIRVLQE
jgi:class 3 adenylate cyclase